MNKRLVLFTVVLLAALTGLLLMLVHWGNRSVELRQDLFVDRAKAEVEVLAGQIEEEYYCFDLSSEFTLPKLDSFYVSKPQGAGQMDDRLKLKYVTSDGSVKEFEKMSIMGPGHMQVLYRFEFDNIPEFKDDESLTDFEKWVRDSYASYLYTEDGIRLVDTASLDTLLANVVAGLHPDAQIRYKLRLKGEGDDIYDYNMASVSNPFSSDIETTLFDNEDRIPDVLLSVEVVNKADLFSGQAWNIYVSALVLVFISVLIVFFLIRMYIQQKNLLQVQKDFVHGMTHEFNTPLSNIKLVAQNLMKNKDEKILKSASILEEESAKLQVGMNLILTTALIEKNELSLDKQRVDLKELILKTIEKNKTFLNEAGIEIDLQVNGDDLETNGDAFHLENVFQNMINNVKKHSQAHHLKVETVRENGHVIVRFADDGKGVSEEDRERIFQKFESRHATGGRNGYGLGLYYSKMILDLHGGAIRLLQNTGRGSIFSIEIPA